MKLSVTQQLLERLKKIERDQIQNHDLRIEVVEKYNEFLEIFKTRLKTSTQVLRSYNKSTMNTQTTIIVFIAEYDHTIKNQFVWETVSYYELLSVIYKILSST